ncbi:MAG: amino acid permease [Legionellales bacterium]|nr:amino acid permease [Legionellales bacterium]|tara:strand:- start:509 stop:1861 length:1353 start_codon:yes stop_codon:yes gene_type:complete
MNYKISVIGLISMVIISIDSIRNLPATALFGSQIILLYLIGGLLFFVPAAFIAAEFTSMYPIAGGVYTWVSRAFGKKIGFLAIWLQWIENVVWFPSIVAFIAATFAYIFNFHTSNYYYAIMIPVIFWGCTYVNIHGIQITEKFSIFATFFGLIIPYIGLLMLACYWIYSGLPIANPIRFDHIMDFKHLNLSALSVIYLSLAGIEITAAHIANVDNPKKTYPIAIIIATVFILGSQILGSIALAMMIPVDKINLIESVIAVFSVALDKVDMTFMMPLVAALFLTSNLGTIINWVIAPIKSLEVAAIDGFLPSILVDDNPNKPVKLLILQAVIVTLLSCSFILLDDVNQSYWLLTIIPAALYLFMYLLMFISYVFLSLKTNFFSFSMKSKVMLTVSLIGIIGSTLGLVSVFIPPSMIFQKISLIHYTLVVFFAILVFMSPAFIMMVYKKNEC